MNQNTSSRKSHHLTHLLLKKAPISRTSLNYQGSKKNHQHQTNELTHCRTEIHLKKKRNKTGDLEKFKYTQKFLGKKFPSSLNR